jgi:hypothetical protein
MTYTNFHLEKKMVLCIFHSDDFDYTSGKWRMVGPDAEVASFVLLDVKLVVGASTWRSLGSLD